MISHHQNSFVILACLLLAFEQLCASINLMEDVILYFQRAITSITEDLILGQDRVGYSLLNSLVVTSAMVECSVLATELFFFFFYKSNCINGRKLYSEGVYPKKYKSLSSWLQKYNKEKKQKLNKKLKKETKAVKRSKS
jgi:hypothetical protein